MGAPFVGAVGFLWWTRPFEEQLYRCAEGHIYSVRVTEEATTTELHESVEARALTRLGGQGTNRRPPGLSSGQDESVSPTRPSGRKLGLEGRGGSSELRRAVEREAEREQRVNPPAPTGSARCQLASPARTELS